MGLDHFIFDVKNAAETAGDDIGAAQNFVATAQGHIDILLRGDDAPEAEIAPALNAIISGAQSVNARAVHRAATAAFEISKHKLGFVKSMQWQGQVLVLNKLISQYSAGVAELQGQSSNNATQEAVQTNPVDMAMNEGDLTLDVDVITAMDTAATENITPDVMPAALHTQSDAFAFAAARDTLAPLLKFVDNQTTRTALSRLARLDDTANMTTGDIAKPSATAAPKSKVEKFVSFEALMPAFTTTALRAARQSDKTVSVSYGANGVNLPAIAAVDIEGLLSDTALWVVNATIERSDIRKARGDSGAAHIAVTVTQRGSDITLALSMPPKGGKDAVLPARFESPLSGTAVLNVTTQAQSLIMTLPMDHYKRRETASAPLDAKVSA